MQKKRRTREHIIADLSANYVERFVLLCGHTIEKFSSDYGYDLIIYTYTADSELENGNIYVQLKATDNIRFVHNGQAISFPLKKKDLNIWLSEPMPVILIVYDAVRDRAYWLYIQEYFENLEHFDIRKVKKYHSVTIPVRNRVGMSSIVKFVKFKRNVLKQIYKNRIEHHV
ncbi:DUF4365 domain-containing protein [Desulfonema magnum]|uniref:DUF4365 n=1 Tax=Desulfonema magnum TaxID=45655 RepID=A0A975BGN5_9BACT|nr:DUF4365 domain-containing protein [Desulfonema magnum]QTA84968.1 DUF4365 [Desulfonema magnum]